MNFEDVIFPIALTSMIVGVNHLLYHVGGQVKTTGKKLALACIPGCLCMVIAGYLSLLPILYFVPACLNRKFLTYSVAILSIVAVWGSCFFWSAPGL